MPFITLEIKNVPFSALLDEAFTLILSVNCTYVLGNQKDRDYCKKREQKVSLLYSFSFWARLCFSFSICKRLWLQPSSFFSKKAWSIIFDSDALFRSDMIFFIFQPCKSSCESYEKKKPKEFLNSFAKLIKKVIRVESSWVLFDILQPIWGILFYIISDNALFFQLFKD